VVTILDGHPKKQPGWDVYDTGKAGGHFVKNPDGTLYEGPVWPANAKENPGPSVFPDFSRPETRDWWGGLYRRLTDAGVAGIWNDMNEPSVFDGPGKTMPLDSVHRIEEPGFAPRAATHAEIHNILGMENQRATYDGLLKLRPDERPFVLTRATYAGGQRYGFTWTGDNSATWNHLRLGTQMLLNLGLSGVSFVGDDIGGFNGSPQPDLLTKWIEVGAFNPLFRDHSTKGSLPQEVWVHGPQQEAIRRRYIEVRYRLMPYIYTLAEEASRTGIPLVRPIFLEFPEIMAPDAPGFDGLDSEFLLGPDLLVAPPQFPEMLDDYTVSYPSGPWFDLWTGKKVPPRPMLPSFVDAVKAGADAKLPEPQRIHPTLETLPVFVRGGSILPLQPLVQSTDETPNGPLELRVYPGPQCNGSLYLDDGHTFRYQKGEFLRQSFSCQADGSSVLVKFAARQGSYTPWWKTIEVVVYDWPSAQADARIAKSSKPLKTTYDASSRALHISISDVPGEAELRVGAQASSN